MPLHMSKGEQVRDLILIKLTITMLGLLKYKNVVNI
jgi:hypothetical protein